MSDLLVDVVAKRSRDPEQLRLLAERLHVPLSREWLRTLRWAGRNVLICGTDEAAAARVLSRCEGRWDRNRGPASPRRPRPHAIRRCPRSIDRARILSAHGARKFPQALLLPWIQPVRALRGASLAEPRDAEPDCLRDRRPASRSRVVAPHRVSGDDQRSREPGVVAAQPAARQLCPCARE